MNDFKTRIDNAEALGSIRTSRPARKSRQNGRPSF
jgi:hypothetical protein